LLSFRVGQPPLVEPIEDGPGGRGLRHSGCRERAGPAFFRRCRRDRCM